MTEIVLLLIFCTIIPSSMESKPGTFFWKPRLAIDLNIPRAQGKGHLPTDENIRAGYVVLLEGYNVGITIMAIAETVEVHPIFNHLYPGKAAYYTNMYRWALRHFSRYPDWLAGKTRGYTGTHKVWYNRFIYNNRLVPTWLQKLIPWVDEKDWKKEEDELSRFMKYSQPLFGKFQKYPGKTFRNFASDRFEDNIADLHATANSLPKFRYHQ